MGELGGSRVWSEVGGGGGVESVEEIIRRSRHTIAMIGSIKTQGNGHT